MNRDAIHRADALNIARRFGIPARAVDIWRPIGTSGRFRWDDGHRCGIIDIYNKVATTINNDVSTPLDPVR